MNQKELDEYVTLFTDVHGACRCVYPHEFMSKHRSDLKIFPKKMTKVSDEFGNLEFLVYYNEDNFPWWVES